VGCIRWFSDIEQTDVSVGYTCNQDIRVVTSKLDAVDSFTGGESPQRARVIAAGGDVPDVETEVVADLVKSCSDFGTIAIEGDRVTSSLELDGEGLSIAGWRCEV
jgi:hypothetical protein